MSIRVLVVDDQPLVRAGLGVILDAQADLAVVGEAGDGLAAVDAAARLNPDVVLMDVRDAGARRTWGDPPHLGRPPEVAG